MILYTFHTNFIISEVNRSQCRMTTQNKQLGTEEPSIKTCNMSISFGFCFHSKSRSESRSSIAKEKERKKMKELLDENWYTKAVNERSKYGAKRSFSRLLSIVQCTPA